MSSFINSDPEDKDNMNNGMHLRVYSSCFIIVHNSEFYILLELLHIPLTVATKGWKYVVGKHMINEDNLLLCPPLFEDKKGTMELSPFIHPSVCLSCPNFADAITQQPLGRFTPPVGSGTPAFRLGSRIDPHRHRGVVKVHWRVPWVGGLFSWVEATFTL